MEGRLSGASPSAATAAPKKCGAPGRHSAERGELLILRSGVGEWRQVGFLAPLSHVLTSFSSPNLAAELHESQVSSAALSFVAVRVTMQAF